VSFLTEVKSLKPNPRDLRKFGLTVGGVFALLGAWFLFRHKPYAWPCLVPGLLLILFGLAAPSSLRTIYFAWMTLGMALGMVVTTVLLTLLFYLVVTPIGLIAKLAGKDFLSIKLNKASPSYWVPKESRVKTRPDYEKQY
jgi:hypothetical protein